MQNLAGRGPQASLQVLRPRAVPAFSHFGLSLFQAFSWPIFFSVPGFLEFVFLRPSWFSIFHRLSLVNSTCQCDNNTRQRQSCGNIIELVRKLWRKLCKELCGKCRGNAGEPLMSWSWHPFLYWNTVVPSSCKLINIDTAYSCTQVSCTKPVCYERFAAVSAGPQYVSPP